MEKKDKDVVYLNQRIDRLEKMLDSIDKKLDSSQSFSYSKTTTYTELEEEETENKLSIADLGKIYEEEGFEAFYSKCREYGEVVDTEEAEKPECDKLDESCTDGKTTFSRLFLCLAFFDISKIASRIVAINYAALNKGDKDVLLSSSDVTNVLSQEQWEKCLMSCTEQAVKDFIQYGEADLNHTFREYQIGRVHLESTYVVWENEEYVKLNLYWTDDSSYASSEDW